MMMRKWFFAVFSAALVLGSAQANAGSVTLQQVNGTRNETDALTGFATTGADMDLMSVTANFSGGGSETLAWADIDSDSGGVSGTGWALRADGDTFALGAWALTSSGASISSIFIDGGPGNTIFDRTFGGSSGTAGSGFGRDFAVVSGGDPFDITVTYSDIIGLTGVAPVGDLFRKLTIDFTTRGIAFVDSRLVYSQDTDNADTGGDGINPVPEPATLVLCGFGIVGVVGGFRHRRK
jgi:hypothetical protein